MIHVVERSYIKTVSERGRIIYLFGIFIVVVYNKGTIRTRFSTNSLSFLGSKKRAEWTLCPRTPLYHVHTS